MTLDDLGNIGEVVGAAAVMVSLIYLAIQVRQNTTQIRENSRISRLVLQENFVSAQQDAVTRIAENPELYRIWQLGTARADEMSDDDRERFGLFLYGQMYRYHFLYQAGSVEPMERERANIQIGRLAEMSNFRAWWIRQRQFFNFDPEFVAFVDQWVRDKD